MGAEAGFLQAKIRERWRERCRCRCRGLNLGISNPKKGLTISCLRFVKWRSNSLTNARVDVSSEVPAAAAVLCSIALSGDSHSTFTGESPCIVVRFSMPASSFLWIGVHLRYRAKSESISLLGQMNCGFVLVFSMALHN